MFIKPSIAEELIRRGAFLTASFARRSAAPRTSSYLQLCRDKKDDSNSDTYDSPFQPESIKLKSDVVNTDVEPTGNVLKKKELQEILNSFMQITEIKQLAKERGLNNLHKVLSDILWDAGNVSDIFPYFIRHAKQIFPPIDCLDDLKNVSDVQTPASWYPLARSKKRKIIFHAGPTNSGKTYHALESFFRAKSGVYCAPLKLLVGEIFHKCNQMGTACDLVTGDERRFASENSNSPANHLSCSVEMVDLQKHYEVAIIDEIQLMRDPYRGWAWTRALLGIAADELHLCGEAAAIELVKSICTTTDEIVDVRPYKRKTDLVIEKQALGSLDNVKPGDCIVCFSTADIFTMSRSLERKGIEIAVIYGSMPPGAKLAQAAKFNDRESSCKVLVATNAIGMGLNLHIRRIIFYSLIQPTINNKGAKQMDVLSVSSALQIAGRAGRYGSAWNTGYVTTYNHEDLPTLKKLLSQTPESLTKAGLLPTADQIELYGYILPNSSLSNLMDIFISLCTVDNSRYFMCTLDDFKFLANMIQHVPLPLRARYEFCCAPINKKSPYVCAMFMKFARQYSKYDVITFNWLWQNIEGPFALPKTINDLVHLETVFDVLDLYLWLSYRFMDLFPDANLVREVQKDLDLLIQAGIVKLTELMNSNSDKHNCVEDEESSDSFEIQTQNQKLYRDTEASSKHGIGKGKLTERLLAEGLLTPQMLRELQYEWVQSTIKRNNIIERSIFKIKR